MDEQPQTRQEEKSLRVEVLQKMTDLATAGFGLVAALAWNDAISAFFALIFPKAGNLIAKFLYAIVITALIVWLTIKLGKLSDFAKKQVAEKKK
ncbi:MAG: DUF5654 family protein [Patescibacteria group bacterium]